MTKLILFGNGYTYKDLIQTVTFYEREGTGSLQLGLDTFYSTVDFQQEFETSMTVGQILTHFGKTRSEFEIDCLDYIKETVGEKV